MAVIILQKMKGLGYGQYLEYNFNKSRLVPSLKKEFVLQKTYLYWARNQDLQISVRGRSSQSLNLSGWNNTEHFSIPATLFD